MQYNGRNYFVDWLAFYIPFIPFSESDRKKEWTDDNYLEYKTYVENKLDLYFSKFDGGRFKPLYANNKKPYNIVFGRKSLKVEFRGSFFNGKSITDDINAAFKAYQKVDTVLRYKGMVKLFKSSIFRLDISTNIKQSLMIKKAPNIPNFQFFALRKTYKQPFQRDLTNPDQVTGYTFGKQGRQSTCLKVYEKKYDPNSSHDLIRFGDNDFVRVEYSIGSDQLKKMNLKTINFLRDLTFNTPFDPETGEMPTKSTEKIEKLLNHIHRSKRVVFPEEPEKTPSKQHYKYIPRPYNAMPTIQSLIFNYTNQADRLKLKEILDNFNDSDPLENLDDQIKAIESAYNKTKYRHNLN